MPCSRTRPVVATHATSDRQPIFLLAAPGARDGYVTSCHPPRVRHAQSVPRRGGRDPRVRRDRAAGDEQRIELDGSGGEVGPLDGQWYASPAIKRAGFRCDDQRHHSGGEDLLADRAQALEVASCSVGLGAGRPRPSVTPAQRSGRCWRAPAASAPGSQSRSTYRVRRCTPGSCDPSRRGTGSARTSAAGCSDRRTMRASHA